MNNLPLLTRLVQSALHNQQFTRIYSLLLRYPTNTKLHLAVHDAVYTSSLPIYHQYGFIKVLRNLKDMMPNVEHTTCSNTGIVDKEHPVYRQFATASINSVYGAKALFRKVLDYVDTIHAKYKDSSFQAHITELIAEFTDAMEQALLKER